MLRLILTVVPQPRRIAAAITARKGETGVYADAQTRMNMTFSEVSSASTDTVSFNLYGKNDTAVLIAANVDFGVTNGQRLQTYQN